MKAELKSYHSPDILDFSTYRPKQIDDFYFLLQLMIVPKDQEGAESFDVELCAPCWLKKNSRVKDVLIGKKYLIVFSYDIHNIIKKNKSLY
mgnify:CR=1 FL=1|jgi:hypothetical protein